ncbi:hypothetical protein H1230_09485 [Paenibacillus sp. 19GGS1-52]|uniref:hypothetical protein n=1 Tax=Paenibacillus sp. 19GGS1-52 TaxID=2758563 RepID=UPI001EFBBC7E|nr:hypothetical protein [Paenibacillus sp. 19GGS1-52]ULO08973.1 hypothetical protein H1230_09485 [Paenibacillus sp. 19GGS1-52]
MVNDVGIHCSEKYVHYINRKRNPREFEWIGDTIAEMNAIFSEMCEDFLVKDDKMMKVARKRINQAKGETENTEETNSDEKREGKQTEQGAFICNFLVIPTNRLRVYDLQKKKITEVGLNIKVYTRISKRTYKCVELDLLNETMANSKWIDPNYLDYDFYLYKENLYPYLLRSIRLATRLLEDDDAKVIFNDEIGWVDGFWRGDVSGNLRYLKNDLIHILKESEEKKIEIDPIKFNAIVFLKAVQGVIDKSKFLEMGSNLKLQEDFIGWENETIWAIKYSLIKSQAEIELKRTGRNFKIDPKLYAFLFRQGILSIEGDVEEVFRPDIKFGNGNKRAFVLDKARVHEFLVENQDILK